MSAPRFTAVGVVVPAHNEEDGIEDCLHGVIAALRSVPAPVATAVCVVLDRCTDRTADRAAAIAARTPVPVDLVRAREPRRTVAALRNVGMRRVLRRLAEHPPAGTWLLSTDADTTVPRTWVTGHLRHAGGGAHAVAGLADLDDATVFDPPVQHAYGRLLAAGGHVYGANLGVRADAFLAVGGFPIVAHGEDHALVGAVQAAGYRLGLLSTE